MTSWKRKEVIGNATLYLGDCLEILPTLPKVDAVITDPPYGLGDLWVGGGGSKNTTWRFNPAEAREWDGKIVSGLEAALDGYPQVIVWGGNYYRFPPSRCWLVWDKKQNDEWTTGQCELAWTNLDRPVRAFRFSTAEQMHEGPKYHPTQKPLALMKWCIKWTNPGTINDDQKTILDPFMGSGTTAIAAMLYGRQFIGIEINDAYFSIAVERITNAQRQAKLFDDNMPPEQRGLAL